MKRHLASATIALTAGVAVFHPSPAPNNRLAPVTRGAFRQSLVERGTIGAAHIVAYGSTIAGAQAKLLEIVPEGRAVAAGDVIIRFDSAPFDAAVARETASVAQADAELVRAGEDLRLEQMRAETDVAAAKDQVQFAETALAGQRDGKSPLAIAEAEAELAEADRQSARTDSAAADVRALFARGFATKAEADQADQLSRATQDRRRIAALRLTTLKNFETPAALARARAEVGGARKAVASASDAAQARLAQRAAAVAVARSRVQDARARLAVAQDQVARTTVRATSAGLALYRELFFGTEKRKPQPGDEVWPNQPLVAIPDPSQLIVETSVRETDLHRVSGHPRVTVAVEAFPDAVLDGDVSFIGALAEADASRAGTKTFPVTIRLRRGDDRLRSGMSARVTIESQAIDNAVLVPLDALIANGADTRCDVFRGHSVISTVVSVLGTNDTAAAVAGAIGPGDFVRLSDPVTAAGGSHQ